jgi:CMP/dCMP kinase
VIIAIDGPAGVGKSTVAKRLAARLGYLYLDTGALYRAVAWKVLQSKIAPADAERVAHLLGHTTLHMQFHNGAMQVFVDGQDVTAFLRTPEVSVSASIVSAIPAVREWLLPVQREIGRHGSVVAEGRDVGTKVFPSAPLKFFLDADASVRADSRDRSRAVAPLVPAADARHIDTSALNVDEVVEHMMAAVSAAS